MSTNNGTPVEATASAEATPTNRLKAQKSAKPKTAADFYGRMQSLCKVKKLTFKHSDSTGTTTVSVNSFPALSVGAIAEAGRSRTDSAFTPTSRIEGKECAARGRAEGDEAVALIKDFFALESDE